MICSVHISPEAWRRLANNTEQTSAIVRLLTAER